MKLIAIAALVLGAGVSVAAAADAPMYVDDTAIAAATSNWDGFYVGIGVGYVASINTPANAFAHAKAIAGVNATFDNFLVGAEGYVGIETQVAPAGANNTYALVGGEVRAGFVADVALLYLSAGAEALPQTGNVFATVGGGVEFLVTDNVSIDLAYKYIHQVNAGGFQGHNATASLNWHFD